LSVFTHSNYIPENAPEVINVDDLPENNRIGETTEDAIAFQYPEGGGISAMLVRQSDISRLNPSHLRPVDKFLSDTLMDFIAKHLVDTVSGHSHPFQSFICSSLFHEHLRSIYTHCTDPSQFSTTWYETFIHQNHMILAANTGGNHFSGTAIWNPWSEEPIIYHYDPIDGYHSKDDILNPFRAYLSSLKHNEVISRAGIPDTKFVQLKGPQQCNSFDCGFHVLAFMKFSLSLNVSLQSGNPYEGFNDQAWSQDDIAQMRGFYFDLTRELGNRYGTHHHPPSPELLNNDSENSLGAVTSSCDDNAKKSSNSCSDTYQQDLQFEEFLIKKFGSLQSYLNKIPSESEQEWLRKVYDQKLDLLSFWKSKKIGINCGYIGNNKEDLRIYKKFLFEPSLLWAPANSHAWDECPFNPNRYPSLYGYQSFAIMEVAGKHFICGYPLYSQDFGHRYMLWTANMTCCWNPRREYILYDTEVSAFTLVQGIL
jgi:hypothetical protein